MILQVSVLLNSECSPPIQVLPRKIIFHLLINVPYSANFSSASKIPAGCSAQACCLHCCIIQKEEEKWHYLLETFTVKQNIGSFSSKIK